VSLWHETSCNHSRQCDQADLVLKPPISRKCQSSPHRDKAPGTGYRVMGAVGYGKPFHLLKLFPRSISPTWIGKESNLAFVLYFVVTSSWNRWFLPGPPFRKGWATEYDRDINYPAQFNKSDDTEYSHENRFSRVPWKNEFRESTPYSVNGQHYTNRRKKYTRFRV
jgi:hypothetical protein